MWGSEQEIAFQEVKAKLTAKPVLKLYNPKANKTELHTDTSSTGLRALLLQADVYEAFHVNCPSARRPSPKSCHFYLMFMILKCT